MSFRRFIGALYGAYAWSVLALLVLVTAIILALLPGLKLRRRVARCSARTVFRLAGIPIRMRGHALPDTQCVVVANHASYLDGMIMFAVLPTSFSFIVKREMTSVPVAHFVLRRIGTEFVERFDAGRSAVDARRILRTAGAGQSLAAFPEGTFRSEPGLGLFRPGAFTAAVRAGLPVVPVTIRGSRSILPAHRRLPCPGRIELVVHAPVACVPQGGRPEMSRVRELSRTAILAALDEPALDFRLDLRPVERT